MLRNYADREYGTWLMGRQLPYPAAPKQMNLISGAYGTVNSHYFTWLQGKMELFRSDVESKMALLKNAWVRSVHVIPPCLRDCLLQQLLQLLGLCYIN